MAYGVSTAKEGDLATIYYQGHMEDHSSSQAIIGSPAGSLPTAPDSCGHGGVDPVTACYIHKKSGPLLLLLLPCGLLLKEELKRAHHEELVYLKVKHTRLVFLHLESFYQSIYQN